jgi:prepilin-type N-terminal cleavage/methylation domain-containing protein
MRSRKGYTLIELVLVLLLLTFVAVAVFLLTDVGSAAYARIYANRDQSADLRIGLSYLDVRLKKIDGVGTVEIRPAPFGGGQALVLTQEIEGDVYETQLYVEAGMLKELFSRKGLEVNADMAAEIARADKMEVRFAGKQLLVLTLTSGSDTPLSASQWIHLRAVQEGTP